MENPMKPRHALGGLLILWSAAVVLAADVGAPQRTVPVTGTAVSQVVPDIIVWQIATTDFDKSLLKAKDNSDAKLKAILKLREELGVKPEDLQTGYLSIEKEYERGLNGERGPFRQFAVRRKVTIRQRDLKRFDEYLSKLVGAAEIDVSFGFESSRFAEIRAENRVKALHIAKEKAEVMTRELGAKLGKVLSVHEDSPQQPQQMSEWTNANSPNHGGVSVSYADADRPADVTSDTFAPGALEIRVAVDAVFEIE
jgi:uncharacterized protein